MSDIADRYRRLSQQFAETIAAVPDARWDDPSPCEDWNARDVVRHVVGTQAMFAGFVGRELDESVSVDDDPAEAWDDARNQTQAALDDPARASETYEGFTGPSTFEGGVDQFLCTDLLVHRWDLARATGQDVRLDPADMAHVRDAMADLSDRMRGPGAIGPELEAPPDADEQTAFLAYFGRRA